MLERRMRMPCVAILCLAAAAGCGRAPAPDPALQAGPIPPGAAAVYTCADDVHFSVRVRGDSATLTFPETAVTLLQVRAASGAKYSAGDTTFWSRGSTASLDAGGRRYTDCVGRAVGTPWEEALHLGVDFRAVGQEPGWTLDLDEGRWLRFLGDYGSTRLYTATPRAVADSGTGLVTLLAEDGRRELRAEIREEPCRDAMSGESYRHSVRVRLDDRTLEGCGRMLRRGEITETYWRLVEIGGRAAVAGSHAREPHLRLRAEGARVVGSTGCNSMSGEYERAGDTLRFGPIATTRMACVDPGMASQERELLRALERTARAAVVSDGLTLYDAEGSRLARFAAVYLR